MARGRKSSQVPSLRYDFPNADCITIRPISDLHIGDQYADHGAIRRLIDAVSSDPDCYTVLVGDLCNTAVAGGKSDVYAESINPGEQAKTVANLLKPIKDKILAVVPGNHEERAYKQAGINTSSIVATLLDIPERYRHSSALVFVSVGTGAHTAHGRPNIYSMYVNHGHGGGGRRAGGKINALQDLGYAVDSDVIIAGHTHMPAAFRTSRIACCNSSRTADMKEQVFVNLASTLKYVGSYGDRLGYQPNSTRYPAIKLYAGVRDISVEL